MAEQALVDGHTCGGALDLSSPGLPAQLPGDLAHLRDGLGGHGLAEARQSATRVHGDPVASEGGVAVVDEALGLPGLAQTDVLVPVELERRRQVVDLGDGEVVGTDTRLFVGGRRDRVAEGERRGSQRR